MENLIIIGAGGLALEILDLIDAINLEKFTFNVLGLLDDHKKGTILEKYDILGFTSEYLNYLNSSMVIAISNPEIRKSLATKLAETKIKTPNLIHPSAEISKYAKISEDSGIIINYATQISAKVEIKNFVIIDSFSYVGHETILNSFVTIYPGSKISGKNIIHDSTEIGLGSNIIQGLIIGSSTLIGAGSTVVHDIPSNVIALGVPCKPIKER